MDEKLFSMNLTKEQVEWVLNQDRIKKWSKNALDVVHEDYRRIEDHCFAMQEVIELIIDKTGYTQATEPDKDLRKNFLIIDVLYNAQDLKSHINRFFEYYIESK